MLIFIIDGWEPFNEFFISSIYLRRRLMSALCFAWFHPRENLPTRASPNSSSSLTAEISVVMASSTVVSHIDSPSLTRSVGPTKQLKLLELNQSGIPALGEKGAAKIVSPSF